MTSAKDWAQELWDIEQSCGMNQQHENELFIQQIQLDAIKEGMRMASEVPKHWANCENITKCILDNAEYLTLKDL